MLENQGIACDLMHGFTWDQWTTGKPAERLAIISASRWTQPMPEPALGARHLGAEGPAAYQPGATPRVTRRKDHPSPEGATQAVRHRRMDRPFRAHFGGATGKEGRWRWLTVVCRG